MTTLTGLSEPELDRWLVEVRKVAALTGSAARDACDVLLWAVCQALSATPRHDLPEGDHPEPDALDEAAYAQWTIVEDLGRLRESIARLRRQQAAGVVDVWEPATLRRQAANVGHLAGSEARQSMAADMAGVQAEAEALALTLDVGVHRQALRVAGEKVITNSNTLVGIAGTVDRAVAALVRLGAVTPEDREMAVQAKRRAARHRSDRKMEDAEVAAAGGNLKKAARLRAEAGVLYRQDAARAGLAQEQGEATHHDGADADAPEP